jgi:hypothetical protein
MPFFPQEFLVLIKSLGCLIEKLHLLRPLLELYLLKILRCILFIA